MKREFHVRFYRGLGVKLPRKVKKVYTSCFPERSYNKIYKRMSIRSNTNYVSTLFKILDYVYYIDDKAVLPAMVNA